MRRAAEAERLCKSDVLGMGNKKPAGLLWAQLGRVISMI
jgi:hypothetical protein